VPLLPEVPESQATGSTAAIFADIKNSLQVPMVNLIYRHLATVPAGLEWAWCSIRPVVVDGTIPSAADRLTQVLRDGASLSDRCATLALDHFATDPNDAIEVKRILDSYNRANPQNLIIVLSLLELLTSERRSDAWLPVAEFSPGSPPRGHGSPCAALPPMIDPSDLAAPIVKLIASVGVGRGDREEVLIPSLYRQLARWPQFLVEELGRLKSPSSMRRIDEADAEISARAHAAANHIVHGPDTGIARFRSPAPPVRGRLIAQLSHFADGTISKMIVMGESLASAASRP
jgi:hypothetical protein